VVRLFVTLGLACFAGCFAPKIQSGGFACDANQASPCPAGFYCVDGLCLDHPGGGGGGGGTGGNGAGGDDLATASDMGAASGDDLASGAPDLASVPDLAQVNDLAQAPPDMAKTSTCAHDKCTTGGKLTSTCDPCVKQICATDSYCCTTQWDLFCVDDVSTICGQTCP
jgi:hypothetical protein